MIEANSNLIIDTYERLLTENGEWAMNEGSRHFDEKSAVHQTLSRICQRLDRLGVPYAVAGGMALFKHGYRRFTEDVDILVTKDGLKTIHKELLGKGFLPMFEGSKNLRDTESKVRIEFLRSGDYPGDGKPKDVQFPDPSEVTEIIDDLKCLNLPTLIELKLASGMSGTDRMKDLADVQELIKLFSLTEDYAEEMNSYVRAKYRELWSSTRRAEKRYLTIWRNKFLTLEANSIDEMIDSLNEACDLLRRMRDDGVTLDTAGGTGDDYAHLVTTDPDVARKYDMHEESEYLDFGEE